MLKVKRAVKFPFLDYSTLEKRKAACEAELAVNRPFAPQIYRGVVAITREASGGLPSAAKATPWNGRSRCARFDENATLDRLADEDGSTTRWPMRSAARSRPRTKKAPVVDAAPLDRGLVGLYRPE